MSLPVTLPANTISIYGFRSIYGIVPLQQGYQFGIINQMYFGAQVDLIGQSVLFLIDNSVRLQYNNAQYFLIQEENIILTEDQAEPEA